MEFYVIGYTAIFFFLVSFFTIIAKWIVKWFVDWKIYNNINVFIKTQDGRPCYEDVFAFNGRVFSIVGVNKQYGREHLTKRISKKTFNKAFDALVDKSYINNGNLEGLNFFALRRRMVMFLESLSDIPMIRNNLFSINAYNLQSLKIRSTDNINYFLVTL